VVDLITAYKDPEGHAREIDINRIVADEKVHDEGVARYAKHVKEGKHVKPLIVIKHPKRDEYAVLDGHHRFRALKKAGMKTVRCAVVEDYVGLGFRLTKNGYFQPPPELTKYVRIPAMQLRDYLTEFLKEPEKMLKAQMKR